MKRVVFVLILLTAFSYAGEFPILDKGIEVRQANLKVLTRIHEVSMEATINYFESETGTEIEELVVIFDDFKNHVDAMEKLTTHLAINNALRELREISGNFKSETNKLIRVNNDVRLAMVLQKIRLSLNQNRDELDDLREQYWDLRKSNTLDIFEIHVEKAEKVLTYLENHDYDTTEAVVILDDINSLKSDLESALEERNNNRIGEINKEIINKTLELQKTVRNIQVVIPDKVKLNYWIGVGGRVLIRTTQVIDELANLDFDVTELRNQQTQAENHIGQARAYQDNDELSHARDSLLAAKDNLDLMRNEYLSLIDGDIPQPLRQNIESLTNSMKGIDMDLS